MLENKRIFTYLFPIILILNGYASGIPGVSLGGLLMVLFDIFAFLVFTKRRSGLDSFSCCIFALVFLFVLLSLFSYIVYGIYDYTQVIKNLLKIFTWLLGVTFAYKTLFDFDLFKPYFRKFCVICTAYLFIQMLAWNTSRVYLPNLFDFGAIRPLYEQYSAEAYISYLSSIGFGRFSSFFAEPSYYGIIMVMDLILIFFVDVNKNKMDRKTFFEVLYIICGVWVSTSTAAILFSIFIIIAYIIRGRISDKLLFLMIGACVFCYVLFASTNSSLLDFFFNKVTTMKDSGRVGGSFVQLSYLSPIQKLFGVGLGNSFIVAKEEYMNQITDMIISFGIVGLTAFFLLFIKLLFSRMSYALFVLIMIYIAAMFQGGYVFNVYGILIMCIALSLRDYDYDSYAMWDNYK